MQPPNSTGQWTEIHCDWFAEMQNYQVFEFSCFASPIEFFPEQSLQNKF